jgi:hypothetical protein
VVAAAKKIEVKTRGEDSDDNGDETDAGGGPNSDDDCEGSDRDGEEEDDNGEEEEDDEEGAEDLEDGEGENDNEDGEGEGEDGDDDNGNGQGEDGLDGAAGNDVHAGNGQGKDGAAGRDRNDVHAGIGQGKDGVARNDVHAGNGQGKDGAASRDRKDVHARNEDAHAGSNLAGDNIMAGSEDDIPTGNITPRKSKGTAATNLTPPQLQESGAAANVTPRKSKGTPAPNSTPPQLESGAAADATPRRPKDGAAPNTTPQQPSASDVVRPALRKSTPAARSNKRGRLDSVSQVALKPKKVSRRSLSHSTAATDAEVSGATDHDVDMENPPRTPSPSILDDDMGLDELQGASRTIGGHFRGKATGNAPNMSDKCGYFLLNIYYVPHFCSLLDQMEVDHSRDKIRGKVLLFTTRSTGAEPTMSMVQDIGSQLSPVLEKLAGRYSPIRSKSNMLFLPKFNI